MHKKRIAVVTPVFPPERGGIGRVAYSDALQLTELGYDVHVYAPRLQDAPKTDAEPFALHRMPQWFQYGHASFSPRASALLNEYDVVVLHFPFFGAAEPMMLPRMLWGSRPKQAKVALVYHMDVKGSGILLPLLTWPTRMLTPSIARTADRVVVTSIDYAMHSRLSAVVHDVPHHFRELPPEIDMERFHPGPHDAALLARFGVPEGAKVVAFTGGLDRAHYFKGVPNMIRALSTAALRETHLILVGDGDLRKEFETLASELRVDARTHFVGALSDDDLAATLRSADIFAFPSTDSSEAFGIAALEALASGVPVVASDLPGVRTVVRDGKNGLLVRPGSVSALSVALARLLGDDTLRRQLGVAAYDTAVRDYGSDRRKERLHAILGDLCL